MTDLETTLVASADRVCLLWHDVRVLRDGKLDGKFLVAMERLRRAADAYGQCYRSMSRRESILLAAAMHAGVHWVEMQSVGGRTAGDEFVRTVDHMEHVVTQTYTEAERCG